VMEIVKIFDNIEANGPKKKWGDATQ
jgi:hypothetical protein